MFYFIDVFHILCQWCFLDRWNAIELLLLFAIILSCMNMALPLKWFSNSNVIVFIKNTVEGKVGDRAATLEP
jgi:hypothetical protein